MLDYRILDKKYAKYLFSHGFLFQRMISHLLGLFYFIKGFFAKYHSYRVISHVLVHNSSFKNLLISHKNYFYEVLFIFNYGWLLYGNFSKVRRKLLQVQLSNLHHLESALAKNKAIIVMTAHIGCFFNALLNEQILSYIKDRPIACLTPKDDQGRKNLLEEKIKYCSQKPFKFIDIQSKNDLLKIVRVLKNNGILICTMDYAYPFTRNQAVKFFDKTVDIPVGIIELGRKFDPAFLPLFTFTNKGQIFLEFCQPFQLDISNDKERDIHNNLLKIVNIIESKILVLPEQWTMWESLYYSKSQPIKDKNENRSQI